MDGAKLLSRENFHIGIIGVIRVAITLKLCPIWLRVERDRGKSKSPSSLFSQLRLDTVVRGDGMDFAELATCLVSFQ